jgi:hypothetical protein
MVRLYAANFYHFVSLSTNDTPERRVKRQQAEELGHAYAYYKWGNYIKHDPQTNLKYI